jgi:two-component system chemotaxis response regulator CheB
MTPELHEPEPFWLIAIAASAGGIPAVLSLLAALPPAIPAAIVVVQHRSASPPSILEQILARATRLPVGVPRIGDTIRPGCVYVARADRHLMIDDRKRFAYRDGTRVRGVLSSANPLFASAADAFQHRVIGVVLNGSGSDATDGVQSVKARGGIVIAQDPRTAAYSGMPTAAVASGAVDRVLPLDAIAAALVEITGSSQATPGAGNPARR